MHLFPRSLTEAIELRAAHPDAVVIAGATAVQPELNAGGRRPSVLLDLSRIPTSAELVRSGNHLHLGPMVTVADAGRHPALRSVLGAGLVGFGNPGVRRRASVIGNVLSSGPRDLAPVLLVLDAVAEVASVSTGRRAVDLPTLLEEGISRDELVVGMTITAPQRAAWLRVAVRPSGARALLAMAVAELPTAECRVSVAAPRLVASRLPAAEAALRKGRDPFVAAMVEALPGHRRAGALAGRCWEQL